MNDPEIEERPAGRPNKTQQKREIAARSELIDRMTGLTDQELSRLGLDDDAVGEIARVRAIRPSGARNRQLKHCVKRLRDTDLSQVALYLSDRRSQQVALNQAFHRLERWRDRLIAEGDNAIGEALAEWPGLERQRLRQLVRDAQRESEHGSPSGAARKLFRYLRSLSGEDTGTA